MSSHLLGRIKRNANPGSCTVDPLAGTSLCFRSVLGTIRPLIGVWCHTAPMGMHDGKGGGTNRGSVARLRGL